MRRTVSISFTILLAVGIAFCVALYTVSEARAATYSQTVDNSTSGRFSASSTWIGSSYHDKTDYGSNYRVLKKPSSTTKNAKYKIKIPAKGSYRVYARWPSDSGYNDRTTYYINTEGGWKYRVVNQRLSGGKWVLLGTYTMKAADSYSVQVSAKSSGKGFIVADAVRVVKATTSTSTTDSTQLTARQRVVEETKAWLGAPYLWGGTTKQGVDCSGLTMMVYRNATAIDDLPHFTGGQWGRGTRTDNPRPGDLVFFGSGPTNISSVGIYTGPDQAIKATVPGDKVRYVSISAVGNNVGGWWAYRSLLP